MYLQQSERRHTADCVITKRIQDADKTFKEGWGSVLSCLVVLIQTIKHQSKRRAEFKIILFMFPLRDLFRGDSKSMSLFVLFLNLFSTRCSRHSHCMLVFCRSVTRPLCHLILHSSLDTLVRLVTWEQVWECHTQSAGLLLMFCLSCSRSNFWNLVANILPLTSYSVH